MLSQVVANAWCEQTRALRVGEYLDCNTEFDVKRTLSILKIFRVSKDGRELIKSYEKLNCNTPALAADRRVVFFLLAMNDDKYYPNDLFMYDGRTGLDRRLFKSTCAFSVSPDARYVCFESRGYIRVFPWRNGKGEDVLSIPIVLIVDLYSMEERRYDFSKSFLKSHWGAGVYIKYDTESGGFRLRFYIEDKNYSKGIISLQDFKYHEEER